MDVMKFVTQVPVQSNIASLLNKFQTLHFQAKVNHRLKPYFAQADRFPEKCLSLTLIGVIGCFFASSFMFAAMTCAYYFRRDGYFDFWISGYLIIQDMVEVYMFSVNGDN